MSEKINLLSKDERISIELERLSQKFASLDENKKAVLAPMIQNAAFMRVTLEDLQEIINRDGVVETYRNGENQYGQKPSSTLQSYNQLIRNYAAVMKSLTGLVPYVAREPEPTWQERWQMEHPEPDETPEERNARLDREWEESVRRYHEEHPEAV
jgi:hypothetical protein